MEKLEKYTKNGYDFTLYHREGDFAIFLGKKEDTKSENWEIIEIQSHDGREIMGNYIPAREFPPSNNQWGIKGWTAMDKEDAFRIFNGRK